jgi:hypothetical protein
MPDLEKECPLCKRIFIHKSYWRRKFCSVQCALRGRKLSEKTKLKMSLAHKGVKNSKQHNLNMSKSKKGGELW